jgi:anti-sigma factor RsiW
MMGTGSDCGFDESWAGRYLAGRLAEAEAEAFEAHYFVCDRCWAEVRAAQELRAALASAPGRPARRRWMPLAAAAALLAGLGTWMLVRPTGSERAFRAGRGAGLAVGLSVAPEGRLSVSWSVIPGTRAYRVRVATAEGALLTESEAAVPPALLDRQRLPPAGTLYVTVEALGPDREVLASSPPVKLPPR